MRHVRCERRYSLLVGIDAEKGVDDCLIQGKTEEELVPKLKNFFNAARKGNMTFSKKKTFKLRVK